MSEYSPQEQAAYDFGFKLGKSTCAEQLAAEREKVEKLKGWHEDIANQLASEREKVANLNSLIDFIERIDTAIEAARVEKGK